MTILLVGGGTGGHITPLLAVAHELKKRKSGVRVIAAVDKATTFAGQLEESADIESVYKIPAGKLRRYPNQTLVQTLLDVKTIALNIRDTFRTLFGCVQAYRLLAKEKPDVVFIKGGFVGVPVGIAAHMQKRPFITHDSDSQPGLANRIIGRWAQLHTVGFNKSLYTYPPEKTVEVGVPIGQRYEPVTKKQQQDFKHSLGIPLTSQLLVVVGGSQGSVNLNTIISSIADGLLANKNLYIIHQIGAGNTVTVNDSERYITLEFMPDLYRYTGAADVVVSRAGSFLTELGAQQKPTITVPAPQLAGGHQLKNAAFLADKNAVIVVDEQDALADGLHLQKAIQDLLKDRVHAEKLAKNLHASFKSDAASHIADVLLAGKS